VDGDAERHAVHELLLQRLESLAKHALASTEAIHFDDLTLYRDRRHRHLEAFEIAL
jgi:hypothetical protein